MIDIVKKPHRPEPGGNHASRSRTLVACSQYPRIRDSGIELVGVIGREAHPFVIENVHPGREGGVGASAARGRKTHPASRTERTGLPRRARLSSKIINDCLLCFGPDHPGFLHFPALREAPMQ